MNESLDKSACADHAGKVAPVINRGRCEGKAVKCQRNLYQFMHVVGDDESEALRMFAGDVFRPAAEREAQEVELLLRGGEEEIALVLAGVDGAMQLRAMVAHDALDVVAGRHAIRT